MKSLFKTALLSATLFASANGAAMADEATEKYILENANSALQSLNDSSLTGAERRAEFKELMDEFTDIELIAMQVLDHYYRKFSDEEIERFVPVFREYALATYEAELDKYRGNDLSVISSQDQEPNSKTKVDSVVKSVIDLPGNQSDLTVLWRVVEFQPTSKYHEVFGAGYKVSDVALDLDGGRIWLAQNQRQQFLSILDRNGGDMDDLIEKVKAETEKLNKEAEQRRSAALGNSGNTRAG